jgi:hypothetical protein
MNYDAKATSVRPAELPFRFLSRISSMELRQKVHMRTDRRNGDEIVCPFFLAAHN